MKMVCTNNGKLKALDLFFGAGGSPGEDFIVELFQNNYTPVDGSLTADFTAATFTGYSAVTFLDGDMSAATIISNVGNANLATAPTFNCTGGSAQTVYGWYLRGSTTGLTYFAQKFDTPRSMVSGAVEALDPFTFKDKSFT